MANEKELSATKRKDRKEREREARRLDILRCAIKAFNQHGFVKTSMDLVADEAALAVGTLYRYYTSKEELYVSIVFDAITDMHDGLAVIADSDQQPELKLKSIWYYFYQFYEEKPMYYQAFLFLHDPSFAGAFSEVAHASVERFSAKNFRLLSKIIREGVDAHEFYPDKPQEVADYLWSAFVGLVNLTETRKQLGSPAADLKKLHNAMWGKIKRTVVMQ